MVGIENEENKELEGATFNSDSLNHLFENILLTLSQLSTDPSQQDIVEESQEQRRHAGAASLERLNSDLSGPSVVEQESSGASSMTILPKKKAHKDRNEQREHRHHGATSSQAAGYSHADFSQDAVRMGHAEIDHRPGNLSELIHVHHHATGFQQQVPHPFPDLSISTSDTYRQSNAASSSSGPGRHERAGSSRKERQANQFDLEASCHAKKRCLSPGCSENFSPSAKQGAKATCGLSSHGGLYSSPNALLAGSSTQEEPNNSDDNNSEDEYYGNITRKTQEDEEKFAKIIEKKGWCIKQMGSDGACLFRAVADQVYGDQEMHDEVRVNCLNYMSKNEEHFSQYVTEDFAKYIARKRNVQCHGNHLEIQALAEVYNRPIEIYYYDIEPQNVFHGEYKTDYPPIRLSYHGNVHYNSIREPYSATVGIGLGLPEFKPGLAEKQQLSEAMKRSEENQIEEAMLKDKMRDSDWDLMQAQIEDQIAQESYRDWLKTGYSSGKRSPKSTSVVSKHPSPPPLLPPQVLSHRSPPRGGSPLSVGSLVGSSSISPVGGAIGNAALSASAAACSASADCPPPPQQPSLVDFLPPEMSDWDENAILAHALAQSTLHYYETLKSGGTGGHSSHFYDGGQPGCSKHS